MKIENSQEKADQKIIGEIVSMHESRHLYILSGLLIAIGGLAETANALIQLFHQRPAVNLWFGLCMAGVGGLLLNLVRRNERIFRLLRVQSGRNGAERRQ